MVTFSHSLALQAGDKIDFVVGRDGGIAGPDSIELQATLSLESVQSVPSSGVLLTITIGHPILGAFQAGT